MRIPIAAIFAAAGTSCPGWPALSRSGSESGDLSRSGACRSSSGSGEYWYWESWSGSRSDVWSASGSEDVARSQGADSDRDWIRGRFDPPSGLHGRGFYDLGRTVDSSVADSEEVGNQ
jgi:hypothetical protein